MTVGKDSIPVQGSGQRMGGTGASGGASNVPNLVDNHLQNFTSEQGSTLPRGVRLIEQVLVQARREGGHPHPDAFLSLSEETDRQIFYSDLLHLGRQALRRDDTITASVIFQTLISEDVSPVWGIPPGITRKAQELWDGMRGRGALGMRLEFLGNTFLREVANPALLVGMGVAGTVASFARYRYLGSFLSRPAGMWGRVLGLRNLASLKAFPWEVGSFWAAHRGVETLIHPEQVHWDVKNVGREWLSLTLGLGFLKLGGFAFRNLAPVVGRHPMIAEQLGMYSGIVTAGAAERFLGLNGPMAATGTPWFDGLVTLVQFNAAGRLSQQLMVAGHGARMHSLEFRTRQLEGQLSLTDRWSPIQHSLRDFFQFQEVGLTPQGVLMALPTRQGNSVHLGARPLLMAGMDGSGGGPRNSGDRGAAGFSASSRPLTAGETPGIVRASLGELPTRTQRLLLDERIKSVFPDYFRHLERLLTETPQDELMGVARGAGRQEPLKVSTPENIQRQIDEFIQEQGVRRIPLQDPSVQESVGKVWINSRVRESKGLSEYTRGILNEIESAHRILSRLTFPDGSQYQGSHLKPSQGLSEALGRDIFILSDTWRETGSFKERGALVEVYRAARQGVGHVVTASHGNHGLAVALAAKKFNLRATIVVPHTTPEVKVGQLEKLGATVVTTRQQPERGYEESRDWGLRYTFERNTFLKGYLESSQDFVRYIHGFEQVIPGQGVAGKEILAGIGALPETQMKRFQEGRPVFLIPLGGGGLAAGVGVVLRHHFPRARIIGVLSEQAPSMHYSLIHGKRTEVLLNPDSLFDSGIGLAVPGKRPFEILREVLDGTVAVNESLGGEAIRWIHRYDGETVEGGAATGIAALLGGRLREFGIQAKDPIVTLFTGRNINPGRLDNILSGREAPLRGGILDVPPGS